MTISHLTTFLHYSTRPAGAERDGNETRLEATRITNLMFHRLHIKYMGALLARGHLPVSGAVL